MTSLFRILVTFQMVLHYSLSASADRPKYRRRTQEIFPRNEAAPSFSPSPTELPTQSPTDTPTFSENFFLKACAEVASNYADNTCDCSVEDQSIVCELPGSQLFPFQYVLFDYDERTGKIIKGSECYCQDEVSCGRNADDYCLSMALVDSQDCAITFLADGAICSNACQPCVDDVDSYGLNVDACFTGGTPNGCIGMNMAGQIGENHDRNMAPPEFIKACDKVVATYPDSTCKCFAEDLRMECSLDNTTDFQNVYLSFFYDSNTTKVNEGFKCFCESSECGQGAADYCISVSLVGDPTCNVTLLQTNEQLVDCCDVCNSPDYYGVNTNECYAEDQTVGCFEIDIDKDSGENHALATSEVPSSSVVPSTAPSASARPSYFPSFSPSSLPSSKPSISLSPTKSPTPPPTKAPVVGTASPTSVPSAGPSFSSSPSSTPTRDPSSSPTAVSSFTPTVPKVPETVLPAPTIPPTSAPSKSPSIEKASELSPSRPTPSPTLVILPKPTIAPTQGPTVETQSTTIEASGDTYIYRSGLVPSEPTGGESTMLVQNGPAANPDVPDAYALISFELGPNSPLPTLTTSRAATIDMEGYDAELCLQHVRNNSPDAVASTLTVCRIDTSQRKEEEPLDADTLTSSTAAFKMPEDCIGQGTMMIDFKVAPDDAEVCIDILKVLLLPSETSSQNIRGLAPQEESNGHESVLLMIDSIHTEKTQGDLFYTKNSGARSPKIIINHPLAPPSPPPTLQPVAATSETSPPTPGVTLLSGANSSSDGSKSKNGLYSLFLLLLIVPIVWVAIRRRNIRIQYDGQTYMEHEGSQYSYNHEEREIGNFDEEEVSGLSSFPGNPGFIEEEASGLEPSVQESVVEESSSGLESFPRHAGMYFTDRKDSVDGEIYEDDNSSVPESSAYDSSGESSDATGSCPW